MNLEFSKATRADLDDLHALIELCYRGEGFKIRDGLSLFLENRRVIVRYP